MNWTKKKTQGNLHKDNIDISTSEYCLDEGLPNERNVKKGRAQKCILPERVQNCKDVRCASSRTFALIASIYPSLLHTHIHKPCRQVNNNNADGHCYSFFLGFNDLGRSVISSFLFRNRFYLQLSSYCPKMNKIQRGKLKKFTISVRET